MNSTDRVHEVLAGDIRYAVLHGEAIDVLRSLPDASVDGVVTDPPYSSGGQFLSDRSAPPSEKYGMRGPRACPDFVGDSRDQVSQLTWCWLWLSEAYRAAKDGSPVVMFSDWRQVTVAILALQCAGWTFRGVVPWCKKGGGRPQLGRFRAGAEFAVWGSKGALPVDRPVGGPSRALAGYIEASPVKHTVRRHLTEKPLAVMRELVRICTPGGVIVDPFAGGGSTGVACMHEGYRFLGVEMTAEYSRRATAAIEAAAAPMAA